MISGDSDAANNDIFTLPQRNKSADASSATAQPIGQPTEVLSLAGKSRFQQSTIPNESRTAKPNNVSIKSTKKE